ncbi:MAG TPA: carboxypeptidase-like regulatory domain-containing protein [Candidatus Dormibacteraeota bacterium]|nr:carboxypeptidase-like regulatory domain-containing protein [Candidatus Dormibacteraeota bacterium]
MLLRNIKHYSVLSLLIYLFVAANAFAQTGTSSLGGTITDQQGRPVAGATVTLVNVATNAERTTQTTDTGAYVFDLITPADYRLEVEAKGFNRQLVDNVKALIGKRTERDVQLSVGTMSEVVEVHSSGQEALINTQDASLGNVFESKQITELPLEGRNLIDLLSLQPGATREGYVTGARADQSNVTLDGVDINNAQTGNVAVPTTTNNLTIGALDTDRGNITSGPVLRLNAEAVEEFRVTTANGNANEGRSSGSQINLVTKSGTNNWHGAAFEFYRGTLFEANDWFSNAARVPRTPLIRNTFGGALGGPVKKDKVFFFYSYESRHDATAQSESRIVPLPNLGKGIINYNYCTDAACNTTPQASLDVTQNQVYQAAGINPAALAALAAAAAKYPANDKSLGDQLNTSGFRFNAITPVHLNSHVARLDSKLTNNQNLFLRANVIYDHQILPRWLPDTAAPLVWSHPWGIAAGHTWTIGNNWVNNFRYGYTRQAFSVGGDSFGNDISFRFVFQPTGQTHTQTRVTPVHNFTDDLSWVHGKHTVQFGANVRAISNTRVSFANAFDNAITNPSFYANGAGDRVSKDFQNYLNANHLPGDQRKCKDANGVTINPPPCDESLNSIPAVQDAATAIIGRFSQYTANFTFNKDGSLTAAGTPTTRNFATQAYEQYVQDSWKVRQHLTFTLGVRYSLERPVYETKGFEVQPTIPLGIYFKNRLAAAAQGQNFTDPIVINRSGPANGGKPMYNWNKLNLQPRLAVAWSPNYSDGFLHAIFGDAGNSVIRSGFAMTNDYYGQALAVDWDLNNTLGFSSNYTTPANTFDTVPSAQHDLGPLFTSYNQDVRPLPKVKVPGSLVFPLSQPLDYGGRIESSVDSNLQAPRQYVWNLTFERQLPAGTTLSVSYIGRMGRRLLVRRDATAFNNVRDPKSGMTWYQAATILEKQRQKGVDTSQIATIPFFENLFPAGMATIFNSAFGLDPICSADPTITTNPGFDPTWSNTQFFYAMQSRGGGTAPSNPCSFFPGNDWTDTQAIVDQVANGNFGTTPFPTRFEQPQYGALSTWSTIGNSNYHGMTVSVRQRLQSLTLDFNYTFSHSFDDASGLQTESGFGNNNGNGAFIVNPIRQHDNYASSDFDVRHIINADAVWQMPFGKGRALMNTDNRVVDAVLGGWQLSGIFRWNSGLPLTSSPSDDARWATNWDVQAAVTPLRPINTCPTRTGTPKLFGGCDMKAIYQSFRNAYPGETGPRNYIRLPGYLDLDLGLAKTWNMPWSEKHHLQVRWDVFNVANSQHFGAIDNSRTGIGVVRDPALRGSNPPPNWSNFTQIQGQPRVMQVGARYSF